MKKNRKMIIFDLDGTISDSFPVTLRAIEKVTGIKPNPKIIREKGIIGSFKKYRLPLFKIPSYVFKIRREIYKNIEEIGLFPGMGEFIRDLKDKGYILGIITKNQRKTATEFLNKKDIELFDFIWVNFFYFEKTRKIKKALRKNKVSPENTFYIGDQVDDITSSKEANIKSIAVDWGFGDKSSLKEANPHLLASSIEEIDNFLN